MQFSGDLLLYFGNLQRGLLARDNTFGMYVFKSFPRWYPIMTCNSVAICYFILEICKEGYWTIHLVCTYSKAFLGDTPSWLAIQWRFVTLFWKSAKRAIGQYIWYVRRTHALSPAFLGDTSSWHAIQWRFVTLFWKSAKRAMGQYIWCARRTHALSTAFLGDTS